MLKVVEGFAVELGGDLLGHLPVAEGIVDVIGRTRRSGIDFQPDVKNDGLCSILSPPCIRTDNGRDFQVPEIDSVQLRSICHFVCRKQICKDSNEDHLRKRTCATRSTRQQKIQSGLSGCVLGCIPTVEYGMKH